VISIAAAVAGSAIGYDLWESFPDDIWVRVPAPREFWIADFRYQPGGEELLRDYAVRREWEVDDRMSAEPVEIRLLSTGLLRRLIGGRDSVAYRNPTPHVSVSTPHGEWWRFVRQD